MSLPLPPHTRYVGRGTRIESSLLLGNGAWLSDSQRSEAIENGQRVYGVGECCSASLFRYVQAGAFTGCCSASARGAAGAVQEAPAARSPNRSC